MVANFYLFTEFRFPDNLLSVKPVTVSTLKHYGTVGIPEIFYLDQLKAA